MNPKIFFGELKRRNVYKVAVAYAVVGWLLIQVATQVFPFLEIPNWVIRLSSFSRRSVFRSRWLLRGHSSSRLRESSGPKLRMRNDNVREAVFGSPLLSSLQRFR